ncbi:Uncharacterised protein [Shigella sonnei]|nr:Uncharacterised protein [Shigella sonnei]
MISSRYRFYVLISEQTTRQQTPWYLSESPAVRVTESPSLLVAFMSTSTLS